MAKRSAYLGQFTWENSNRIAGELEGAGIEWWYKQSGAITQFFFRGDWGVRLFVDADRLDEARAIAARVLGEETGG